MAPSPSSTPEYSLADQKQRHAQANALNNQRVLNIDAYFDPLPFSGKRVLVIGASRGLGKCLLNALVRAGAKAIGTVRNQGVGGEDRAAGTGGAKIIPNVDTTLDSGLETLLALLTEPVDVVIYNAGYFWEPRETLENLNYDEQLKQINVCAIGALRMAAGLVKAGRVVEGGKIALVTSQAGSLAWREIQNPDGDNYGHHMSRACTNMMGRLLSFELRGKYSVALLHPGFNRTDMTAKFADIWEEEGAVDPEIGAKRVLHEVNQMTLENTGRFVNCEDGLLIPW